MEYVAGIDLGTSYFKVGLFNRDGRLCGLGRTAVVKDTDDSGLCELPVERFWQFIKIALNQACMQAEAQPDQIKGIGYSSQANSFILLDKHHTPLTPLILWPDRRVVEIDTSIKELWQRPDFLQTTGMGGHCSPCSCVAKLKWFESQQPTLWSRVRYIMTISDYLVHTLTGKSVGDGGTASLLGFYDVSNHRWWNDAFASLKLEQSCFSTPLLPGSLAGEVSRVGSDILGLSPNAMLTVGSLDHYIAAFGAGVPKIATVSESIGTVLACVSYSNRFSPKPGCCTGPGIDKNTYYQIASSSNVAGVLVWYQKNYAPQLTIPELLKSGELVSPDANGLIALPCANEYVNLTGFKNILPHHGHGHFVRAILELSAATSVELIGRLVNSFVPPRIVATGGGAKSQLWLQINADRLKTEFVTTDCEEPACRGGAMLAALSFGWLDRNTESMNEWVQLADKIKCKGL